MNARIEKQPWRSSRGVDTSNELYDTHFQEQSDELFDVRRSLNAVWRGRWTIAFGGFFAALLAYLAISQLEPQYTSSTSILFESDRLQIMEFEGIATDPTAQVNLGDQMEILSSSMLLARVVDVLNLDAAPFESAAEPEEPSPSMLDSAIEAVPALQPLLERIGLDPIGELEEVIILDEAQIQAQRTRQAIAKLNSSLALEQVRGARVIQVSITDTDPEMAANIANTIAEQYITVQNNAAREEVQTIIDALNARIEELRVRLDGSEQAIAQARIELSERQAQSSDMTSTQLNAMNSALADLRLQRTAAEGRYERAALALEMEEDLWVVTEFRESALISAFREREIQVLEELAESRAITGENRSPVRTIAEARLQEIRRNIREEASYIVEALAFEVSSLRDREEQLETMVRGLELTRIEQTADELRIERLEREALATRNLYEGFADRVKEVSEQANLPSSSTRILSMAEAPRGPDRDNDRRAMAVATVAGVLLAIALVLIRDRLNNSFRSPKDLTEETGFKVIASIPQAGRRKATARLIANLTSKPKSLLAESIRNLRTSVLFADPERVPSVLMMTSSVPNEGKTSTSVLLGIASQQMGRKTILVACDFRDRENLRVFKDFVPAENGRPGNGFGSVLAGKSAIDEAILTEPNSGLHVLALSPDERINGSPADVLASKSFESVIAQLRKEYQLVILDTPPALAVTDARLLARLTDTIVYLVRWNHTGKNAVKEGLRELGSMHVPIAGCVFTCVAQKQAAKYIDNESFYKRSYASYYG